MSKKNKNKAHSIKEALKAQNAVSREFYSAKTVEVAPAGSVKTAVNSSKNDASFFLPIKEIKKDLVKNVIFAVFSILVITVLKFTNFGFIHFSL